MSTEIWLLPKAGEPKNLLEVNGTVKRFVRSEKGIGPGVWINRETYDGSHSETKGFASEFHEWDVERRQLR